MTVLSNIELFLENEKVIHINRNNLNRFYIKRMNSLVSSLFSKTCTLNAKEKKLQIKKICQTSIFKNACLASIPNLEKKNSILKIFYKKIKYIYFIIYLNFLISMEVFMKESESKLYSPCTIKEIQRVMLNIMIEIDSLCRRHDIDYWLSDGTYLALYVMKVLFLGMMIWILV